MTREEAKEIFLNRGFVNGLFDGNKWRQSIVVISEWLEQEPCEDCISRTQAIKAMDELENEDIEAYGCSIPEGFDGERARKAICLLPSIQPKPKTDFEHKAEIVISQLRADRDRLQDAIEKIRAEIEQEYKCLSATRADETLEVGECLGLKMALKIIDKYIAENEDKNGKNNSNKAH